MAPRQSTPAGEAIIADELAAANGTAASDPPPPNVPFTAGDPTPDAEPEKPRRGRPPGSKNTGAGRRSRASKIGEIRAAADEAIKRGALLAAYAVHVAPMPPDRKIVWLGDTEIVSSPKGREALLGSLEFACNRNAKIERLCTRMIEASAYTGIGAAVVFGLVLPIAMNHGLVRLPPQILAMMQDADASTDESPFAGAPENAGEVPE